ncbi:hypothetical protein [Spirosoma agri]|uniref:Uncharacterized protein n=1 Tax=Spirosoma agri TaxID=1987381 RepID=A0A6M0IIW9_9BACT|nr:hypothetical protein [Spirosoma agri]NEU67797.1 hypothetical protein [Spirosoma agri]
MGLYLVTCVRPLLRLVDVETYFQTTTHEFDAFFLGWPDWYLMATRSQDVEGNAGNQP